MVKGGGGDGGGGGGERHTHTQPHILHIRNKHYSCVSDVQAELERLGSTPLLDLTGVP